MKLKYWAALGLAIANGAIAGLTYLASKDPSLAVAALAIATGIEGAIHYEDKSVPPPP
jgi:hypothetical protein